MTKPTSDYQSGIIVSVPETVLASGKAQVISIIRRTDGDRKLIGFAYHLAEVLPNGGWGKAVVRSEAEIRKWQE